MGVWTIDLYETRAGRRPVQEFMDQLPPDARAKLARSFDLLERFGLTLTPPYLRKVGDHVWELRTTFGGIAYRILLFGMEGGRLVLSHATAKKSMKLKASDIRLTERRRREYIGERR